MGVERVQFLTEKEREALRLVPICGTVGEIASELGISESAVKQRFTSATRKLGVDGRRHKAARILLDAEGWPYPDRTGPDRQVEEERNLAIDEAVERAEDRPEPSITKPPRQSSRIVDSRLNRFGVQNGFNKWQRLAIILAFTLLGLLIFAMTIATLTETGRFHREIVERNRLK